MGSVAAADKGQLSKPARRDFRLLQALLICGEEFLV
jgi:hypothetical protein